MGTYFSNFMNHASLTDYGFIDEYIPEQSMEASAEHLALGVDAEGKLAFMPMPEGTYMAANSAWLSLCLIDEEIAGLEVVYLGMAPVEPEPVKGDLNGDGALTVSDVTALIHYVLAMETEEPVRDLNIDPSAADINGDGRVNISDVTYLLRLVLAASGNQEEE